MKGRQYPHAVEGPTIPNSTTFTGPPYDNPTKQPEDECSKTTADARMSRRDSDDSEMCRRRPRAARLKPVESSTRAPVIDEGLQGEIFHGLLSQIVGLYTWQSRQPLTEDEIQTGLTERVRSDLRRQHYLPKNVRLTDWHGGWTPERTGIFAVEVWHRAGNGRSRHLGRVSLTVKDSTDQEIRRSVHIAC
jgi:hypothetical protein